VARSFSGKFTIGRIAGKGFYSPPSKHYNALAAKGIIRSPITSCSTRDHSVAAAFAENGIGREGGDGSAQRGRSVIYDCLVVVFVLETDKCQNSNCTMCLLSLSSASGYQCVCPDGHTFIDDTQQCNIPRTFNYSIHNRIVFCGKFPTCSKTVRQKHIVLIYTVIKTTSEVGDQGRI